MHMLESRSEHSGLHPLIRMSGASCSDGIVVIQTYQQIMPTISTNRQQIEMGTT